MEAKYSDLKPSLSQLCKISPQNLILVDIVQAQFRVNSQLNLLRKASDILVPETLKIQIGQGLKLRSEKLLQH